MPVNIRFIDEIITPDNEPLAYIYYKSEGWFSLHQIIKMFLPKQSIQSLHLSVFSAQYVPKSKYYDTKLSKCRIIRLRNILTTSVLRRMCIRVEYIIDIQSTKFLLETFNPKIEAKVLFPFVEVIHRLLKKGGRKRTLSTKERMEIAASQSWECQECYKDVSSSLNFEIDHIYAFSKGGNNHKLNLQTLCLDCHKKKTKQDQQPIFRHITHEINK